MPLDPNTETGSPQIPAKQLHYAGTLQELEANLHEREIGFCTETRLCYIKDQFGALVALGGGEGRSGIFYADYDVTTYAEIVEAFSAGNLIIMRAVIGDYATAAPMSRHGEAFVAVLPQAEPDSSDPTSMITTLVRVEVTSSGWTSNAVDIPTEEDLLVITNTLTELLSQIIPEDTAPDNPLTNKGYVDNQLNQVAAKYLSRDESGNPFETYEQFLAAQSAETGFYYAGSTAQPTKNDYVLVSSDSQHDNAVTRYWFTGSTWSFQYVVNNTPFTDAEWAAIRSGITSARLAALEGAIATIPTKISQLQNDRGYATWDLFSSRDFAWASGEMYLANRVTLASIYTSASELWNRLYAGPGICALGVLEHNSLRYVQGSGPVTDPETGNTPMIPFYCIDNGVLYTLVAHFSWDGSGPTGVTWTDDSTPIGHGGGGLDSVTHDTSLAGNGTSASPLGLNKTAPLDWSFSGSATYAFGGSGAGGTSSQRIAPFVSTISNNSSTNRAGYETNGSFFGGSYDSPSSQTFAVRRQIANWNNRKFAARFQLYSDGLATFQQIENVNGSDVERARMQFGLSSTGTNWGSMTIGNETRKFGFEKSAHINEYAFTEGTPVNILSYGTDKFWITVSGTQLTLGYSNTSATPRLLDTKNGAWSSSGGTRVNCGTSTGSFFDRDMYVYDASTGGSVTEYSIRVNISGTKLKVTAIY